MAKAIVVVLAVVNMLLAFVVLIFLVSELFTAVKRVFGIQNDIPAREIAKKCEHKGTEEEVA